MLSIAQGSSFVNSFFAVHAVVGRQIVRTYPHRLREHEAKAYAAEAETLRGEQHIYSPLADTKPAAANSEASVLVAVREFVISKCDLLPEASISNSDLYASLAAFCQERNLPLPSQRSFALQLSAMGIESNRTKTQRSKVGIAIRSN